MWISMQLQNTKQIMENETLISNYWNGFLKLWSSRMQHRHFQAGLLQCTVEWRTGGDFRQATVRPEQPGQSQLPELGSHRRQAAASLTTLASDEAAGHL